MSLTCKDLMIPPERQAKLSAQATVRDAFYLMREGGMRFLPVIADNGDYLGVFTSPTFMKLLLPRAITIHLGGHDANKGLNDLNFYKLKDEDFYQGLKAVKDEPVLKHLSNPKDIPTTKANAPIIEGMLLLYRYKRHVILLEGKKFVGVLSINAVMRHVFADDIKL